MYIDQQRIPSHSIWLFWGFALFWCWVSLVAPVTIPLIEFCFIMIFIMIVVTIIGIFMAINYFLSYTLGFLYLSSSGSAMHNSLDVSTSGHSPRLMDWTCYLLTPLLYKLRSVSGVPEKSSRGLGSMSRHSAQILICCIAYIFNAGLPVCTVPSAIVHCNHNEAGHRTIKAPGMPCWGTAGPSKHSGIYATDWWNWQIKWMKSVSMGCFKYKNQVNEESLHTCE